MNAMDSRRTVSSLIDDRREASATEDERRTIVEIVEDWSVLIGDIDNTLVLQDVSDQVTIQNVNDTKIIIATPVAFGDYDDDIDR